MIRHSETNESLYLESATAMRMARCVPFHESVVSKASVSAWASFPSPPPSMVIAQRPRDRCRGDHHVVGLRRGSWGTHADAFLLNRDSAVVPPLVLGDGRFVGRGQESRVQGIKGRFVVRPHVNFGPGFERDRVHRGPASDAADVEGGLRLLGHLELGNLGDGSAERMNRVDAAELTVAVPAGALVGEPVAEAANANMGHAKPGTVHGNEAVDLSFQGLVEQRLGSTQITQALFAHVRDEGDQALGHYLGLVQSPDDTDEDGEAPAVIADARTLEPRALPLDLDIGLGWKDGVEVGRHHQVRLRAAARTLAQDVPDRIDADIPQAELREDVLELQAALLLRERRSRDLANPDLLGDDLGFVNLGAIECRHDGLIRDQAGADILRRGRGRLGKKEWEGKGHEWLH